MLSTRLLRSIVLVFAAALVGPAMAQTPPKKTVTGVKPAPVKPAMDTAIDEQQLRMKQEQDRRAKAATALSNTMKKQAETQSTVTGNLK